jgi:hypothetical protein
MRSSSILNLPRVSGLEVYPTVRRLLPRAPVAPSLSGNVSAAARAELEEVGQPAPFCPNPADWANRVTDCAGRSMSGSAVRSPVAASTSA